MKFAALSGSRSGFAAAIGWLTAALTFLLPLKFGSIAVMSDAASLFPDRLADWAIVNWPAHGFGLAAGALLVASLLALPPPRWNRRSGIAALLWGFGFALAVLPGWVRGDWDTSLGEFNQFAAIGAFTLAVHRLLCFDEVWRRRLIAALACGTLVLVALSLHQYFFGFAATRAFVAEQRASGIDIGEIMMIKLADDRVYGPMVSCNVLAGYLLLALPLFAVCCWRFGACFTPERLSRRLFLAAAILGGGAVLLLTRSRGAWLCAGLAAAGYALSLPGRKQLKLVFFAVVLLAVGVGAFAVAKSGRGFGSMAERVDYLGTSAAMVVEKPLLGWGWGGFFRYHMLHKRSSTDESAHDPHNFVAAFTSQCGVPAGILVLLAAVLPGFWIWRRRNRDAMALAAAWGWGAFMLHSLMELNMQIPANFATAALLMEIVLAEREPPEIRLRRRWGDLPVLALAAAAIWTSCVWLRGEVALSCLTDLVTPATRSQLEYVNAHPESVSEALERTAAARPRSGWPWMLAGDWAARRGAPAEALRYYRECLLRGDDRPAVFWRLARLAAAAGDPVEAERLRGEAARRFPANPKYRRLEP